MASFLCEVNAQKLFYRELFLAARSETHSNLLKYIAYCVGVAERRESARSRYENVLGIQELLISWTSVGQGTPLRSPPSFSARLPGFRTCGAHTHETVSPKWKIACVIQAQGLGAKGSDGDSGPLT